MIHMMTHNDSYEDSTAGRVIDGPLATFWSYIVCGKVEEGYYKSSGMAFGDEGAARSVKIILLRGDDDAHASATWGPSHTFSILVERDEYQRCWDLIRSRELKYILLRGTKGIGKSVFIYWLIYKLVQDAKTSASADPLSSQAAEPSATVDLLSSHAAKLSATTDPLSSQAVKPSATADLLSSHAAKLSVTTDPLSSQAAQPSVTADPLSPKAVKASVTMDPLSFPDTKPSASVTTVKLPTFLLITSGADGGKLYQHLSVVDGVPVVRRVTSDVPADYVLSDFEFDVAARAGNWNLNVVSYGASTEPKIFMEKVWDAYKVMPY
jgi:hypothetical protein